MRTQVKSWLVCGTWWLTCGLAMVSLGREARDVVGLDGEWRVVFDRANPGMGASWWRPEVFQGLASRGIPVPGCWGAREEDYEGVAWYAREVALPEQWTGRHVRLGFDAVNYRAEVWWNGEMVGGAESGFTPVEFDVTPHLEYGATNRLIVRVVGPAVLLVRRHRVSLAGRALDPTRMILDESGGARSVWGSFPDIAANVERFRREGNPKTPPYKYHEELLESLREVMEKHRLGEIFPDVTSLCLASQEVQALGNKLQVEALRVNPKAGGYCIHAYTDGDWVVGAGVLDLWREPKKLYGILKEVQRPLYLAVRVSPANVYASKGAKLTVVSANDGAPVGGRA